PLLNTSPGASSNESCAQTASLARLPEPVRTSTDFAPVNSHKSRFVDLKSAMKTSDRCDTGPRSKALRTSTCTSTGPGRQLARIFSTASLGGERALDIWMNFSSVRYIGWNCASPVPTTGPNGTKPRCL